MCGTWKRNFWSIFFLNSKDIHVNSSLQILIDMHTWNHPENDLTSECLASLQSDISITVISLIWDDLRHSTPGLALDWKDPLYRSLLSPLLPPNRFAWQDIHPVLYHYQCCHTKFPHFLKTWFPSCLCPNPYTLELRLSLLVNIFYMERKISRQ